MPRLLFFPTPCRLSLPYCSLLCLSSAPLRGPGVLWCAAFLAACHGPWPERCSPPGERCSPPGAARALLGLLVVQVLLVWCQIADSFYLCVFYSSFLVLLLLPSPLITFRYQRLMKSDYYNINFLLFCPSVRSVASLFSDFIYS